MMVGGPLLMAIAMQGAAAPVVSHIDAYRACGVKLAIEHAAEQPDAPPDLIARASTARCDHLLPAAIADLPEADTPEKQALVMDDYRQRSNIELTRTIIAHRAEQK